MFTFYTILLYHYRDALRGQQFIQTQSGDKHDPVDTRSVRETLHCAVLGTATYSSIVIPAKPAAQISTSTYIPHTRDSLDTYLFSSERLLIDT
jgi:hypothetical protein